MITAAHSEPGSSVKPDEDWFGVANWDEPAPIVVLDGGTARTETGCIHGVSWYSKHLGTELLALLQTRPNESLRSILARGIAAVAELHRDTCDLNHPGTPSAAVAIVRPAGQQLWEYAILGDVTVVLDTLDGLIATADNRISESAKRERIEADRWPIGSAEKESAMIAMKHVELAARNRDYWIAAADARAADHALIGKATGVTRIAILTDGAARANSFGLMTWSEILETMERAGPTHVVEQVRAAEDSDPTGQRWARNKKSDDATVVYLSQIGG
ncbi:hypothetical protein EV644_10394 [Kribbella orskensis]|uniref:Protein phosphatase 2C-like protein n=1 Tax=Kribbella orskensis TaxID=2512216 RepID=A0ABY2BP50_9ACTN|nr:MULTISPECIES: hypothetical protein [Kribbella]TCN39820.1 hypothetical protein EV642_106326 [Kribbella sp. VKM Ac-2500]TCO27397.1 hypothetical protein EV644_10394 [Kribbella orskensis]